MEVFSNHCDKAYAAPGAKFVTIEVSLVKEFVDRSLAVYRCMEETGLRWVSYSPLRSLENDTAFKEAARKYTINPYVALRSHLDDMVKYGFLDDTDLGLVPVPLIFDFQPRMPNIFYKRGINAAALRTECACHAE